MSEKATANLVVIQTLVLVLLLTRTINLREWHLISGLRDSYFLDDESQLGGIKNVLDLNAFG